jgi:uncharacterized DUF497 family protein
MRFGFDSAKSAKNEQDRGLPFGMASRLFEGPRLEWEDRRHDYGEIRINALGDIQGRVFFVSYTKRAEVVRVISFRRANRRETNRYQEHVRSRGERYKD